MRIDILGLQAFIAIADKGSFLAAADELNLSQTALSHRIAKLEESLGIQLFSRNTRQLAVTSVGMFLLPRARRAVDDLEVALLDVKSLGEGRKRQIVIGSVPSLASNLLADILVKYRLEMPDVRVRVLDGYASTVAAQVNSGQVEFGLMVRRGMPFELTFRHLMHEAFVALCRADHALATRDVVTWAELADHDTVGNTVIDHALRNSRSLLDWRYHAENVSTAISFVEMGLGVTIIPALETRRLHHRHLHVLRLTDPVVTRPVGIITRPDMPPSRAAERLIDLIVDHVAELTPPEKLCLP